MWRAAEFTASEFAADLHLVRTGQATSPEYGDPVEFFTRTYLTEGLRDLLSRALRRVGGGDGNASPVVNLQTNFGGGKTHSMLALYHLFSGTPAKDFRRSCRSSSLRPGTRILLRWE
jgi:predicted AAA+ superfamily ATPase